MDIPGAHFRPGTEKWCDYLFSEYLHNGKFCNKCGFFLKQVGNNEHIEGWAEKDDWWTARGLEQWEFTRDDGSLTEEGKKEMTRATLILHND